MADSYNQPTKQAARKDALSHAVELLTTRRKYCPVLPREYVSQVISKLETSNDYTYQDAARSCDSDDIESWKSFYDSTVSKRNPEDLTVAYLAGPEPINDIEILLGLGIRAENIWAFELNKETFISALKKVEDSRLRGIKLINLSIDDYFQGTAKRFDIIYFDACAPLPSAEQKTIQAIANIFRHSALAPLGVLITNFSAPDTKHELELDKFTNLIAAYLYPKPFLDTFDDPEHTYTDGAESQGYILGCMDDMDDMDDMDFEDFCDEVRNNFIDYYGSFITRHIVDIASIISPMIKLLSSPIEKQILNNKDNAIKRAKNFLDCSIENDNLAGEAITSKNFYSLLFTLYACGLLGSNGSCISETNKKFFNKWVNQLAGKPNSPNAMDAISCFYSLRHDTDFWAASLEKLSSFDYWAKMHFLCDVPNKEMAFYSAFAQATYPAHNNVKETRRFSYIAEGKSTTMLLDVLPFDECRYIYDWLSTAPLMVNDWSDSSNQNIFRFALDGIAKNIRWYQDDFLYGCHAVSIDNGFFKPPTYKLRENISTSP